MPDYKRIIFGAIVVVVILDIAYAGYRIYEDVQNEKPKVMTTEQTHDPKEVAKEIHVTTPAAQTIVREIERSGGEAPSITYYVQSPSLDRAAETVQKQIETKSPEAPSGVLSKSDRTIVTADKQLNKVDVYKINLRRAHKLKAGMTYVNDKSYISAGYQAGRLEGLVHFDTRTMEPKGGTITYTVLEW